MFKKILQLKYRNLIVSFILKCYLVRSLNTNYELQQAINVFKRGYTNLYFFQLTRTAVQTSDDCLNLYQHYRVFI